MARRVGDLLASEPDLALVALQAGEVLLPGARAGCERRARSHQVSPRDEWTSLRRSLASSAASSGSRSRQAAPSRRFDDREQLREGLLALGRECERAAARIGRVVAPLDQSAPLERVCDARDRRPRDRHAIGCLPYLERSPDPQAEQQREGAEGHVLRREHVPFERSPKRGRGAEDVLHDEHGGRVVPGRDAPEDIDLLGRSSLRSATIRELTLGSPTPPSSMRIPYERGECGTCA